MPGEAGLPAHLDVVAEGGGAGDADLGDEEAAPADPHVMADLHEVVDLRPFADDGLAEGGTVDGRAGADLHVVLDAHDPDLRDLVVLTLIVGGEAEAVRADHHAAVDDAPPADPAAVVDRDVGKDDRAVADERAGLDGDVRVDHHVLADDRIRPDGGEPAHGHVSPQLRRAGDLRPRRDPPRRRPLREKPRDGGGHGVVGIGDTDPFRRIARQIIRDQHCRRIRGLELRRVLRVGEEGDVAAAGLGERKDALDGHVRPRVGAGDEGDDFREGNGGGHQRADCSGGGEWR
jgi:hypothetical protein